MYKFDILKNFEFFSFIYCWVFNVLICVVYGIYFFLLMVFVLLMLFVLDFNFLGSGKVYLVGE